MMIPIGEKEESMTPLRKLMLLFAATIALSAFMTTGCGDDDDNGDGGEPRVEILGYPLDGAALARPVASLEDDHDA